VALQDASGQPKSSISLCTCRSLVCHTSELVDRFRRFSGRRVRVLIELPGLTRMDEASLGFAAFNESRAASKWRIARLDIYSVNFGEANATRSATLVPRMNFIMSRPRPYDVSALPWRAMFLSRHPLCCNDRQRLSINSRAQPVRKRTDARIGPD